MLCKDAPNVSPAVISRLTAEWEGEYFRRQQRDLPDGTSTMASPSGSNGYGRAERRA